MTGETFTVEQIDHVGVCVPDRHEAVAWYQRVFGLVPLKGAVYEWAVQLPNGPLCLGNPQANLPLITLVEGTPEGEGRPTGHDHVAFRVSGAAFAAFVARLDDVPVYSEHGERITAAHIADHKVSWAIYFSDPYGNRYELTTYDYKTIARERQAQS